MICRSRTFRVLKRPPVDHAPLLFEQLVYGHSPGREHPPPSVDEKILQMTNPTVLVATWSDGLSVIAGDRHARELDGQSIAALASDGRGGVLAIVGGRSLRRRAVDGVWSVVATTDADLAC